MVWSGPNVTFLANVRFLKYNSELIVCVNKLFSLFGYMQNFQTGKNDGFGDMVLVEIIIRQHWKEKIYT